MYFYEMNRYIHIKYLTILFFTLTSCTHQVKPSDKGLDSEKCAKVAQVEPKPLCQDSIYLAQYLPPQTIRYKDAEARSAMRKAIEASQFDSMKYNSVKDIDTELSSLFKECPVQDYSESWKQELADKRLEFHLRNKWTFAQSMPLFDKEICPFKTDDGKYKIYSYPIDLFGTRESYKSYIQYIDAQGEANYIAWENDAQNGGRCLLDVWQFTHEGTSYYALKSFKRLQSCTWEYYLDIATIEDGKITYHPEFIPQELDAEVGPHEQEYLIFDEYGSAIDEEWRKVSYAIVCRTENCNTNIDYTFNPRTMTVYIKDDADTTDSRTGAIKKRSVKLLRP